jgi:hypothetical protein
MPTASSSMLSHQRKLVNALDFRTRWQLGLSAPCDQGLWSILDISGGTPYYTVRLRN